MGFWKRVWEQMKESWKDPRSWASPEVRAIKFVDQQFEPYKEKGQWEFAGENFYKKGEKATFRNKLTGKEITLTGDDYNIEVGKGRKPNL